MKKKIVSLQNLIKIVDSYKKKNIKIVWTNGCFDILHIGHIKYLEQAKKSGDILIVGLNSDNSVKKLKGENRPIFNENDRATVLSFLTFIDHIIIFDQASPSEMLDLLQPHYYIKGGDYTIDTIDQHERRLVEAYEGRIKILPYVKGVSTSDIIKKIRLS